MRGYLAFLLFAGVLTSAAAEPLCLHEKNMLEEAQCLSAELDKAEKVLADYLDAAKQQIASQNGKPQLDQAQEAWLRYRSAHCADVYTYWEAGTYRYRAELECEIELTQARTHQIWSAYLRRFGSGPHVRPEP